MGQAEKTELDAHFENLLSRADYTKNWTEKIYRQTEVLLQPNPSMIQNIKCRVHAPFSSITAVLQFYIIKSEMTHVKIDMRDNVSYIHDES